MIQVDKRNLNVMNQPYLNHAEKESPLWKKLKAYLEDRLEASRKLNDSDLTVEQTAKQRGKIAEIKSLLALETPPPSIKSGDE